MKNCGMEDWNSYLCRVNDTVASIFLNLGLRPIAPDRARPWLLWVWVYMKEPREDGLSSSAEFDGLGIVEDHIVEALQSKVQAEFVGRITTDGRREFYFYAPRSDQFPSILSGIENSMRGYEFDSGSQEDLDWSQYLSVLYPSEEDLQKIKDTKVLEVLSRHGDNLRTPREVCHWIYFTTPGERSHFNDEVKKLGFEIKVETENRKHSAERPFCSQISRIDNVDHNAISEVTIQLFKLSKRFDAEYDGWETQVISKENQKPN